MRLLFEIFAQTLRTLWAHKLRSFLTMFGIAWGVGSLLLLVGLGEGFRSGNRKQFDDLGENVMFIWGGRAPAMNGSFTGLRQYYLTYKDYLDILRDATDVRVAAPVISRADVRAVSDFYNSSGQLMGGPASFNEIRYLPIEDGRWLNELDDTQKRAAVVLGDEARRVLFAGRPSVGSTILLNGVRFQVIGTLKRIGRGDNNPLITTLLIALNAMNLFLGSVGLVTLALGAIGIINIMLVAVADRTHEIGLRKALGATKGSIMFQFFIEGAFLTLLSGGIGMGGAAALMAALGTLPQPPGFDTPKLVPMTAALAITSLAFSGVVAGLYPARKAADLQPVEALRRE